MDHIIPFPKKESLNREQIEKLMDDSLRNITQESIKMGINVHNFEFLRDLALTRKILEAAFERQMGVKSEFVKMMDNFYASLETN